MDVQRALELLREVRSLLRRSGSRRSLLRVRSALKSTEGALRHAQRLARQSSSLHPTSPH